MRRPAAAASCVFLLLALALADPRPAQAQAATAVLRIRLRDGADAIAGGIVTVDGPEARRTETTDARGFATILHLRPGRYRVRATAPGGRASETLVLVGAGGTTQLGMQVPVTAAETPEATAVTRGPSARGALFTDDARGGMPRPADPWSLARDMPGVVLDRVDVGGSDTGQQSLVVSGGDPGTGATWSIDGASVTDPAAVGSTSIYPDVDSLSVVEVRTSALDVRVRTPGAQVALFTRDTAPRWSGRARARGTGLQSDNVPSALFGKSLVRNQTERVTGFGGELGGPIAGDRGTVWAAWGRNAIRQETFTGHDDTTSTTDLTARASARVGGGTISLLGLSAEKVDEDRDVSLSASPESRWRQSGPSHLLAAEDRRDVGALSLLTHVSYLDAGFRLQPHGGTTQSAYEDFRGVFQRSYQRFETDRPRVEAGTEASASRRALGFDHVLIAGGTYGRSVVSTDASWPGNQVLAYERQSVFFRAFGLTGFALPTRGQSARSLQQDWAGYAQDEARRGRLGLTLGLRLERAAGRNLSSSVEANPAFPDLLPAARYAGGPTEIRWLDLLPRAGVSWDLDHEGRTIARLSYAAYADPMGAADITSDNPLGDGASLTYYWIDRNGDHTVERGELDPVRGLLGASGVDPSAPGTVSSPQAIAPGLRAPRTSDFSFALEHGRGARAHAVLQMTYRRLVHPLWNPLIGLSLSDYVIRGGVQGTLFGDAYDVGYYAPASLSRVAPGNGRVLANREGYRQDVWTADLSADGRLGTRLFWQASAAVSDWREFFSDPARSLQDPTSTDAEPLLDGGTVAARPGGLGRGDVFASARWTAALSLRATVFRRIVAATRVYARDGFPSPYFQVADTGDPTNPAKNVLVSPRLDAFRLPALFLADARLERGFAAGPGTLTAAVDVFNLLDRATTLQVARDVDAPSFARPLDVLRPRIVRFGLEYRF